MLKWSEVTQLCPTVWDPMDCSLPGSSVHGIFQARVLEWVAISFSRNLPNPGIEPVTPIWQPSSAWQADSLPLSHLGSWNDVHCQTNEHINCLSFCEVRSLVCLCVRVWWEYFRSILLATCNAILLTIIITLLYNRSPEFIHLVTGSLISCSPRDSQESSPNTTVQKHQFFSTQPSLWPSSHIHTWLLPVNPKGNQSWIVTGRTDAKAEAPILWLPDAKNRLLGKDPDAGKDWRREEKGMTEDEMVEWHHWLNGHEFE